MTSTSSVPRIGVSACVLGHQVRYNGGHKLDRYIRYTVGAFAELVPICPEKDIGLGVPRETLRLVQIAGQKQLALVAPQSGSDHTEAMTSYARAKAVELKSLDLCGFIVKRDSPSCGMERVKVYPAVSKGSPSRDGRGAFTDQLMQAMPLLPIEEDGRLHDPVLRENFFERVFAYRRLKDFFASQWRAQDLMTFHAREKLLLMAHADYRPLGKLVAQSNSVPRDVLEREYSNLFLTALANQTSIGKHSNVLQHIAGYFRKDLDEVSQSEVHEQIESYRNRLVPLVVPVTLMRHHIRQLGLSYLRDQSYLWPHPPELALRNHA